MYVFENNFGNNLGNKFEYKFENTSALHSGLHSVLPKSIDDELSSAITGMSIDTIDSSALVRQIEKEMSECELVCNSELKYPEIYSLDRRMVNWKYISTLALSHREYDEYKDLLDWDVVSERIHVTSAIQFRARVNWNVFIKHNPEINYRVYMMFEDIVFDWTSICAYSILSDEDIDHLVYMGVADFSVLVSHRKLSSNILNKYASLMDEDDVEFFQLEWK